MIRIVNMVPRSLSGETNQDSEPNIAVNPARPSDIVATAFTPAAGGSFAPIYVSTDGGASWSLRNVVPGNGSFGTGDISVGFATTGGMLYAGTLNGQTGHLQILRTADFKSTTAMTVLVDRLSEDQPWVIAGSVVAAPGGVVDRVFVGNNNFNQPAGATATVDVSQNAATAPAPAGFAPVAIERRPTVGQDGPPVRLALHTDGTVYAAFHRWASGTVPNVNVDIVVTRDDNWGAGGGGNTFSALVEPGAPAGDGLIGQRVATGQFVRWNAEMGQERLGGDLATAVHPADSNTVYVAWCNRVGGAAGTDWTLHVRRSTNRGVAWSNDLRTITNAKNPALAVNSRGRVGLLYQEFTGTRWVSHLELTDDGWATPAKDLVLHTAPSNVPGRVFWPYLGDYTRLLSVGANFYGVFSGNNTPTTANFPNGVTYQRNANWTSGTLLNLDNVTPVNASIDPFFFNVTDAELQVLALTDSGGMWHTIRREDGWQASFGDVGTLVTNDPGYFRAVGSAGVDGELQLVALTDAGGMWHTIRHADGTWHPLFGDVKGAETNDPGYFSAVACAGVAGELQVVALTDVGGMWHTIRQADGSWVPSFGDVKGVENNDPGHFSAVGCAGVDGELHVIGLTSVGGMWHTIRHADGSWAPSFGDVKGVEINDPGHFSAVACAGVNGELHVLAVTNLGGLWQTIRHADGSWQSSFGDVKAVQTNDPGHFSGIACAGVGGELQLVGVTDSGGMWHTIRHADGTWQPSFADVKAVASNDPGYLTAVACGGVD